MPSCFVPGCNSGYGNLIKWNKANGVKNPSMFKAPNNDELLQKWQKAVPRADKILTKKDKICEVHFKSEEIEREYTTKMPDGTAFSLKRGTPKLKPDAIPSIFPNCPKYLTVGHSLKCKDPTMRTGTMPSKRKIVVRSPETVEIIEEADEKVEIISVH